MDLAEIAKFLTGAAIGSGLVGFYFQRRLKRTASYEATTAVLLEKMLIGVEQVISAAEKTAAVCKEIEGVIDQHTGHEIARLLPAFTDQWTITRQRIAAHRFYLTPLIPYGVSWSYETRQTVVVGYLRMLHMHHSGERILPREKIAHVEQELLKAVREFLKEHNTLRDTGDRILRDINGGKPIFD
jgi:hypothetical protein